MSQLAAIPSPPRPARPREFPSVAPAGFLEGRTALWSSQACAAGDHRFDVSTESAPGLVERLQLITRPLVSGHTRDRVAHYRILRGRDPQVPYALYFESTRLLLARSVEPLVRFLCWHVNQSMVARSCRHHVVLHAATATRAGITVMLPGDQEHGKTTTVAGLLREGYDYVTDEATVIQPATLQVLPFPKALSIDEGSWHLFPECRTLFQDHTQQWQVPAEVLGGRSLHRPVAPPKLIVFPKYCEGASTTLVPASPGQAVTGLVSSTFRFTERPGLNLAVLGALASGATAAYLRIGDLEQAVLMIDRMLSEFVMRGMSR